MIIVILKSASIAEYLSLTKFIADMTRIFSFITITLLVCFVTDSFAQANADTLLLVNGDVIITSVKDTSKGEVTYANPKAGKKDLTIENDRIFSIKNTKGETVYYKFDSLLGNDITVDEMRYYIKGEQDAQKNYKARGYFWGNIVVGAAAGATGHFLSPVAPFAFTAITGLPAVHIDHSTVSNLEYLKHDTYVMGYERMARGKRRLKSMLGGGIGLAAGLGVFWGILQPSHNELIK